MHYIHIHLSSPGSHSVEVVVAPRGWQPPSRPPAQAPLWVYVLGVLGGLALLTLLIGGLYKVRLENLLEVIQILPCIHRTFILSKFFIQERPWYHSY